MKYCSDIHLNIFEDFTRLCVNDIDILVIKVLFWTIHLRFEPKMIKN